MTPKAKPPYFTRTNIILERFRQKQDLELKLMTVETDIKGLITGTNELEWMLLLNQQPLLAAYRKFRQ